MSENLDYLEEADALLRGEPTAIEIHPPSEIIQEVDGKLYSVPTPPWIKLSTAFRQKWGRKLKGSCLSVFLMIAMHINTKLEAHPSIETLAKETGYSTREVSRAIKELEEMGLLSICRGGISGGVNYANLYTLKGMVSFGDDDPKIISPQERGGDFKSSSKSQDDFCDIEDDLNDIPSMTPTSNQVESLSRVKVDSRDSEITDSHLGNSEKSSRATRQAYLEKVEARKNETRESIKRFEEKEERINVNDYPEDVRHVIGKVCELWSLTCPPMKSSLGGYWLKGGRDLTRACEGHVDTVLSKIKKDLSSRKDPLTIASPNSLVQLAYAKVGELKESVKPKEIPLPPGNCPVYMGGERVR